MTRTSIALALAIACALPALPAVAKVSGPVVCSASMLRTVSDQLPVIFDDGAAFPVRDLSCDGLTQVHAAVNRFGPNNAERQRERIRSLFRREGLLR